MRYILTGDYHKEKAFLKQRNQGDYFFRYKGGLYSMEDREQIHQMQELLLDSQDYGRAKIYNEFLMEVSLIKKLPQWSFYPVDLQIEHTNRCNGKCIMCGHFQAEKKYCRDIDGKVMSQIEPFLPFCRYVGLHGYGEPFLTDNMEDYFRLYQKYRVRLYTNSNLNYLPERYLPYIRECFDEINVSCDGVTNEVYEKIRRGLSFDCLKGNLAKLRKYCPDLRLRLFVVVMRQNVKQLPEFVNFAAAYGFSEIVFSEMITLPEYHNQRDSVREYPQIYADAIRKTKERAEKTAVSVVFNRECRAEADEDLLERELGAWDRMEAIRESEIAADERKRQGRENLLFSRKRMEPTDVENSPFACTGICDVFFRGLYCTLEGQLAACCVDGRHYVARLEEIGGAEDYWNTPAVRRIRESFERGKLPRFCGQCNFLILDQLKRLRLRNKAGYLAQIDG